METVASADGTQIAYQRTGSGPPLVLVHGGTADHTRWEPVRPAFEEHFTVCAIDRRGRGESGDAAEYDLDREVEDVVAVVESLGERVTLFGHSYGAICALEAALRTDDLRGVVLYEPPLPVTDSEPDTESVLAEMEALHENGADERALVLFLREIVGLPSTELDALRSAPNWPARVEATHTVIREERARKAYEFDADRFAELIRPTLLLTGSESSAYLRNATTALDEALPNSRIVVLEGEGHVATSTAPELVVDEVLAFVRSLGDRR